MMKTTAMLINDSEYLDLVGDKFMLAFARAYPARSPAYSILQSLTAKLTLPHHVLLLDKVKDPITRQLYAEQAAADGLSVRAHRDRDELEGES